MRELNSLVLKEFARRGLSINEGVTVDAMLVKSASKPLSKEEVKGLKEKRERTIGSVDKNGNAQGRIKDDKRVDLKRRFREKW